MLKWYTLCLLLNLVLHASAASRWSSQRQSIEDLFDNDLPKSYEKDNFDVQSDDAQVLEPNTSYDEPHFEHQTHQELKETPGKVENKEGSDILDVLDKIAERIMKKTKEEQLPHILHMLKAGAEHDWSNNDEAVNYLLSILKYIEKENKTKEEESFMKDSDLWI